MSLISQVVKIPFLITVILLSLIIEDPFSLAFFPNSPSAKYICISFAAILFFFKSIKEFSVIYLLDFWSMKFILEDKNRLLSIR